MVAPHGGTLVNRIVVGQERERLLGQAARLPTVELDAWALSDVEMIPPPVWRRRRRRVSLGHHSVEPRRPSARPAANTQVVG